MEKLFYVLERIFRMTHIPVHFFDSTGEITLLTMGFDSDTNPLIADLELRKRVLGRLKTGEEMALDYEEDMLCGVCTDAVGNYIVLGPIRRNPIDMERIRAYAGRHGILSQNFRLQRKTLEELSATLAMVVYETSGKMMTEPEILRGAHRSEHLDSRAKSSYQAYELDYAEKEPARFNFSEERKYTSLIKNGDVEGLNRVMAQGVGDFEDYSVGNLAQKAFKQHEYMACSLIILASRAAIEGGMDSLSAYLMSDLYLQQLEKCREIPDIHRLIFDVMHGYTESVRQKQEENSQVSYVEQSKKYVATHLNKRFTVEDLAKEIGVDRTYLSKRFSQAEGMGIQEYTRKKRVEAAANMLKFSDESILTIASYFCFTSQSHFGKIFREYMGETPQKYRDSHKLVDFKK